MAEKGAGGNKIIVVRKKKGGHAAHHGGSWKVAYADFVTAMMAFFLVMWIMGMDPAVKDMIQGYFNNPVGYNKTHSGGANVVGTGNSPLSLDAKRLALLSRETQRRRFEEARTEILERLEGTDELKALRAQVEIVITDEGLRIELVEAGDGETFFAFGSASLKPGAARALALIARELAALPNDLMLEGHTDAAPYGRTGYSNWELSVDRANAARRAMEGGGIEGGRVVEVRGYADRELRVPTNPLDPSNRRVSILLPFKDPQAIEILRPVVDLSQVRSGD
jgi:chemotaxis protein MotB